ncbi:hypothetical protein N0V93_001997 [Gnomoniopsis smithogilvyi]|uniref:Peroxidase n=1 Tax=Gnomoniopsis smithogilvyi TaxID=1191159 RepID=A0A9W9D389_9PEZI|nr:hypothetical protein N0V93_001997 [Gnomoniopsis smithogilvyi]
MYFIFAFLFLALISRIQAYPGMDKLLGQIHHNHRRQDDEFDGNDSTELIGDLLTLAEEDLTRVGLDVRNIILGAVASRTNEAWAREVPDLGTTECAAETCCVWQYIANDMEAVFREADGRCTALARAAIRLGFHDAGTFSKATGPYGGADGSILLAPEEMLRSENTGLQTIAAVTQSWYDKYAPYGISMADLIQLSSNVAGVVCPLGPRTRTFVGRVDNSSASPEGLLPSASSDAATLVELFKNKTIGPHGLVALVGAHTTSVQYHTEVERAGAPQDSTPGVWDVLFYSQTLETPVDGVFSFASDLALSQSTGTADEWTSFAYEADAQEDWNEDYAREYIRLSLLSVYNINDLTECTKVLPPELTNFNQNTTSAK